MIYKVNKIFSVVCLAILLSLSSRPATSTEESSFETENQESSSSYQGQQKSQPYLQAASTKLSYFFSRGSFANSSKTVMRHNVQHNDYPAAYNAATSWFNYIIQPGSSQYETWNLFVGNVYSGLLIGGGRANLRNYGSSGPQPTIDLFPHNNVSHNTPGYERVSEFKFFYNCCIR